MEPSPMTQAMRALSPQGSVTNPTNIYQKSEAIFSR